MLLQISGMHIGILHQVRTLIYIYIYTIQVKRILSIFEMQRTHDEEQRAGPGRAANVVAK